MNDEQKLMRKVYLTDDLGLMYLAIGSLLTLSFAGAIARMMVGDISIDIAIGLGAILFYALLIAEAFQACLIVLYGLAVVLEDTFSALKETSALVHKILERIEKELDKRNAATAEKRLLELKARREKNRIRYQELWTTNPQKFNRIARIKWGILGLTSASFFWFLAIRIFWLK